VVQPLHFLSDLKSRRVDFIDLEASQLRMWIHHHDDKVKGDFQSVTKQDFEK